MRLRPMTVPLCVLAESPLCVLGWRLVRVSPTA